MRSAEIIYNPRGNVPDKNFIDFVSGCSELKGHYLFQTSGSLGSPKWVALSKLAVETSAKVVNSWLEVDGSDNFGLALPTFHVGGFGISERARVAGKIVRKFPKWIPTSFSEWIETYGVTLISLVPAQIFDLVRIKNPAPKNLRAVVVGGGSLPKELYFAARKLDWPLLPSYGLTECSSQVATARLESLKYNIYPPAYLLPHIIAEQTADSTVKIKSLSLLTAYVVQDKKNWALVDPKHDDAFELPDIAVLNQRKPNYFTEISINGRTQEQYKILGEWIRWPHLKQLFSELSFRFNLFGQIELVVLPNNRSGNVLTLACERFDESVKTLVTVFNAQVFPFERITHFCETPLPRNELGKVSGPKLAAQLNSGISSLMI